ncbi:MAG: ABC transporter ATP-binding protein [Alkalispirochaeta sp.]
MIGIRVDDLAFSYGVGRERPGGDTVEMWVQPFLHVPKMSVREGSISVLIGDNGCGKTTLLKLLAGLLAPSAGAIETGRQNPVLVHQRPYLFAESVRANVAWPLKIQRVARDEREQRVSRALEQVGLASYARRWAPSLSGGEKQRVAIARALVLEPSILLLDEPTSNIDAVSVAAIESLLRTVADSGTTVVMSTHNHASAYRLADELLPMDRGRLTPVHVNILAGVAVDPGDEHIGRFRVSGGADIFCPAAAGDYTRAVIRMEDIILSAEEMASSAQNQVRGIVQSVESVRNELVRVDLDCGYPLSSLITHRSVDELNIAPGAPLYATFKASAVRLY